ncbi:hypothetical protein [Microbacterium aurum]
MHTSSTRRHAVRAGIVSVVVATALLTTAVPASASTVRTTPAVEAIAASGFRIVPTVAAGCASGRCTVWLSKSETAALGKGKVPAPPVFVPVPIKAAYYAAAYVHRWIANSYASRGMCSGFRLSIYPWETQGYFGYYC